MVYKLSKLTKYNVLVQDSTIANYLPRTRRMSRQALWEMVKRYGRVIIKPTGGSGGRGVFQVSSLGVGRYKVHSGTHRKELHGKAEAYAFIRRLMKGDRCLVQRKISLARISDRPFDIRVMVQRKRGSSHWQVTGKLAKIAGPGYLITNTARSGGKVTTVSSAIRRSKISARHPVQIQHQINWISRLCARKLRKRYPKLRIVGIDIGLDGSGKPWIIEANFKPSKKLFLRLKNKSSYHRIIRYS